MSVSHAQSSSHRSAHSVSHRRSRSAHGSHGSHRSHSSHAPHGRSHQSRHHDSSHVSSEAAHTHQRHGRVPNFQNSFGNVNKTQGLSGIRAGNSAFGNKVARDAARVSATGAAYKPGHFRCYAGVKMALANNGVNLQGGSAYQAAGQLAKSDRYHEIKVGRDELSDLKAGSVVVWNRNPKAGHKDGHISVALGDGMESSDRFRKQITNYRSSYRVFEPNP